MDNNYRSRPARRFPFFPSSLHGGADHHDKQRQQAAALEEQQQHAIPDAKTMQLRIQRRNKIISDQTQHVQTHPHQSPLTRNICSILYDRQVYGPQARVYKKKYHPSEDDDDDDAKTNDEEDQDSSTGGGDGGGEQTRSPSTVLDSPASSSHQQHPEQVPRLSQIPISTSAVTNNNTTTATTDSSTMTTNNDNDVTVTQQPQPHRVVYPTKIIDEIRHYGEYVSSVKYQSDFLFHLGGNDQLDEHGNYPPSSKAVSTISIAFAPNGQTLASTHGDHTVKITCCSTGRLLQSLEGHPRTPWTVKYHPTNSNILASGCLGHQVRVWNWPDGNCLQMVRLEFAIISLSFHPTGRVLAVANGTRLHFWGIQNSQDHDNTTNNNTQGNNNNPSSSTTTTTTTQRLLETDQRHMLRCVHFPPDGKTLIIGGVNPIQDDPRSRNSNAPRRSNNSMSFYLRLWDFDLEKALEHAPVGMGISMARRAISNPRTFVPRALLYNDGGFDVSPDGKRLCACAEYWLPEGVDNAMDLLHREELTYEAEMREKEEAMSQQAAEDADREETNDMPMESTDTHSAVSAALESLKGIATANRATTGRSCSFREDSQTPPATSSIPPRTPIVASPGVQPTQSGGSHSCGSGVGFVPRTPPVSTEPRYRNLSPPPPPGRYIMAHGHARELNQSVPGGNNNNNNTSRGLTTPPAPPPPPPPSAPAHMSMRPPHPLSVISAVPLSSDRNADPVRGRYVPHVVVVSLDTTPIPEEIRDARIPRGKPPNAVAKGYRARLGQLLEAHPLDANKASAVTCVKFSPSTDFCLIGYGVREPVIEGGGNFHPVTAVYRIKGGMTHVSTMLSGDDDVNIARFHPDSGHSFVYGTKQGRVRVQSPLVWNFYAPLEETDDNNNN